MKVKKLISSVLLAFTIVAGGLTQIKPANAATLSKKQVVSVIKDDLQTNKNGKYDAIFNSSTLISTKSGKTKKYHSTAKLSGAYNKDVVQLESKSIQNNVQNKKVVEITNTWTDINNSRFYSSQDGKWVYSPITKEFKGSLYEQLANQNTQTSFFIAGLKGGKLTSKNGTYTLTSTVDAKKHFNLIMKMTLVKDFSNKELKQFRKQTKIKKVKVVYTVRNNKLVSSKASILVSELFSKQKTKFVHKFSHFGEYANLVVPDDVKNTATLITRN